MLHRPHPLRPPPPPFSARFCPSEDGGADAVDGGGDDPIDESRFSIHGQVGSRGGRRPDAEIAAAAAAAAGQAACPPQRRTTDGRAPGRLGESVSLPAQLPCGGAGAGGGGGGGAATCGAAPLSGSPAMLHRSSKLAFSTCATRSGSGENATITSPATSAAAAMQLLHHHHHQRDLLTHPRHHFYPHLNQPLLPRGRCGWREWYDVSWVAAELPPLATLLSLAALVLLLGGRATDLAAGYTGLRPQALQSFQMRQEIL
ncbi:hypothetical protein PLESTB_001795300 [Pleodorina starrii]|uniref:Uncharacterized protein n=1 Tax=Pleodorina starrii TaxID=330485 RepID=A0A9W6C1E2_9CHLO|nr:hypothetical protein PLESTM_001159600 [Pleodorina starrii]GLC61717.1 hypothetical protein PLESTB_001795300 [Pleodorina starrii]GLC69196.1 hypothetical protein PLESTF_000800900 [Pleodorina starrii]